MEEAGKLERRTTVRSQRVPSPGARGWRRPCRPPTIALGATAQLFDLEARRVLVFSGCLKVGAVCCLLSIFRHLHLSDWRPALSSYAHTFYLTRAWSFPVLLLALCSGCCCRSQSTPSITCSYSLICLFPMEKVLRRHMGGIHQTIRLVVMRPKCQMRLQQHLRWPQVVVLSVRGQVQRSDGDSRCMA